MNRFNFLKKNIICLGLLFVGLMMTLVIADSVFSRLSGISVVYADDDYSEEEKAAAKAWLVAHGYPPTRAGAAQAYQDFLDGKLDNDPDVRKYKGLDDKKTTVNNQTGGSSENDSVKTEEEIDLNAVFGELADKKAAAEEARREEIEAEKTAFENGLRDRNEKIKLAASKRFVLDIISEEKETPVLNIIIISLVVMILVFLGVFILRKPLNKSIKNK